MNKTVAPAWERRTPAILSRRETERPSRCPRRSMGTIKRCSVVGWKTAQHFPRALPIPPGSPPPDKAQRGISVPLSTLRLHFTGCCWPQCRQDAFIRAESRGPEGGIHVGSSHLQEDRNRRLVAQQRRRGHSQRRRRSE